MSNTMHGSAVIAAGFVVCAALAATNSSGRRAES